MEESRNTKVDVDIDFDDFDFDLDKETLYLDDFVKSGVDTVTLSPTRDKTSISDFANNDKNNQNQRKRKVRSEKERLKRKDDDLRRKLKSLQVSEDDIRRTMIQTIFKYFGSHDFKSLKKYLEEHAEPQFLFKYERLHTGFCHGPVVLPKNVDIRGNDNLISFLKAIGQAVPDQVYKLSNIMIRNGPNSSFIRCDTEFIGTGVYGILMKQEENKKKNDQIPLFNVSAVSHTLDHLDCSEQHRNDSSTRKFEFENGGLLDKIGTVSGKGTSTIYLNKDLKMYFFDHKLGFDDEYEKFKINISDNLRKYDDNKYSLRSNDK